MNIKGFTLALLAIGAIALGAGIVLAGGIFDLSRSTSDGGGGMFSTGGDFGLSGTIGQADAGFMNGGAFELAGGFWFSEPLGDCNASGSADLFDHQDFSDCLSGPDSGLISSDCNCFDQDGDNDVDLGDFEIFQAAFLK